MTAQEKPKSKSAKDSDEVAAEAEKAEFPESVIEQTAAEAAVASYKRNNPDSGSAE